MRVFHQNHNAANIEGKHFNVNYTTYLFCSFAIAVTFVYTVHNLHVRFWNKKSQTLKYYKVVERSADVLSFTKNDATIRGEFQVTERAFKLYLNAFNLSGRSWSTFQGLEKALYTVGQQEGDFSIEQQILKNLRWYHNRAHVPNNSRNTRAHTSHYRTNITLAVVACGERIDQAITMLKSAIMFSQDASLHLIVFADEKEVLNLAQKILCLKWTVNAIGIDFTFELHLESFPNAKWKSTFRNCATQRLFFSTLLPLTDAVMYIDTDVIVISNLTKLWLQFPKHMKDNKMIGASLNDEISTVGYYTRKHSVAFYGTRGLNSGTMLMNLTQMREFKFEERAMAAYTLSEEKLRLGDQDILNIMFNIFPDRVHELDCSFNFRTTHCSRGPKRRCRYDTERNSSWCFCNGTINSGVKLVHGSSKSFYNPDYPFLQDLYANFEKFDFLRDTPEALFTNLGRRFKDKVQNCRPLSAVMLYTNALQYLQSLEMEH